MKVDICQVISARPRKSSAQHRTSGEHQAHSLRHGQMQVYNRLGGQQNGGPDLSTHVDKQGGQSTEIHVQLYMSQQQSSVMRVYEYRKTHIIVEHFNGDCKRSNCLC